MADADRLLVRGEPRALDLEYTETGAVKWKTKVPYAKAVNTYHGAYAAGYLVSQDSTTFWMIDPRGAIKWTRVPKQ